jgi:hypothetical protein
MQDLLVQGLSIRDAVRKMALSGGRSRNELYALALQITEEMQEQPGAGQAENATQAERAGRKDAP